MREVTFAQAITEAISEEMRKDPDIFLIGEDIGKFGGAFGHTAGLFDEFGKERIMDTPISEVAIMGTALGSAISGMRPIAEIMYNDFITIASDQLVNQAAKIRYMFGGKARVPMVVKTACGSGRGQAAQHSQSLEAWFAHIPGLKVVMPSTPYDAKGLFKSAIRDDNPVLFLEHKALYKTKGMIPDGEYTIPLGKADVKREGKDASLITYGKTCLHCLEAAEILKKERSLDIEVVDIRTMNPLDTTTIIESVKKTKKVIIAHEAVKFGGFGGELAGTLAESEAFYYLDAPIRRVGGVFAPIAKAAELEKNAVPTVEKIIEAVNSMM